MIELLTPQARKEHKLQQLFVHCPDPDPDYTDTDNDEDYKSSEIGPFGILSFQNTKNLRKTCNLETQVYFSKN